jgi:hypothetical protein
LGWLVDRLEAKARDTFVVVVVVSVDEPAELHDPHPPLQTQQRDEVVFAFEFEVQDVLSSVAVASQQEL